MKSRINSFKSTKRIIRLERNSHEQQLPNWLRNRNRTLSDFIMFDPSIILVTIIRLQLTKVNIKVSLINEMQSIDYTLCESENSKVSSETPTFQDNWIGLNVKQCKVKITGGIDTKLVFLNCSFCINWKTSAIRVTQESVKIVSLYPFRGHLSDYFARQGNVKHC